MAKALPDATESRIWKTLPSFARSVGLVKVEPKETLKQLMNGVSDSKPCSCSGLAAAANAKGAKLLMKCKQLLLRGKRLYS